jgi:hypothetical protein
MAMALAKRAGQEKTAVAEPARWQSIEKHEKAAKVMCE